MSDRGFIAAPATVKVEFAIHEALIANNMLALLPTINKYDGVSDWMVETMHALEPEDVWRLHLSILALNALDSGDLLEKHARFLDGVEVLAQMDPLTLRDKSIAWWREKEDVSDPSPLLSDVEAYLDFQREMRARHEQEEDFDEDYHRWVHGQLNDPVGMQHTIVTYMRILWDRFMRDEWTRNETLLRESQEAYAQSGPDESSDGFAAVEAVTGRNMRGAADKLDEVLGNARRLIFMPSPHLGPYISWTTLGDREHAIFFGARLPKNARIDSPALNRSDLLVRLNALADDTRLRILEMLVEDEEICAQDFINRLGLSQSSASRHLRQLTASGYLTERRRDVAKCYTLNRDRIQDTIIALQRFVH